MELESYLDALASAEPTPGGGSAATIVAALAASLVAMVARITSDNPNHAAVAPDAARIVGAADALRAALVLARRDDEAAYALVVKATALPKDTTEAKMERTARVQAALRGAAAAPLHAATLVVGVLALARDAAALGNRHLRSDVACAEHFARAALRACAENVRINHVYMRDPETIRRQEAELADVERAAAGIAIA